MFVREIVWGDDPAEKRLLFVFSYWLNFSSESVIRKGQMYKKRDRRGRKEG